MRLQIARARAANPPSEFFYPEGGETAEERNFRARKRKNTHINDAHIFTLADKPCVEQTLFEKFNRVGADAANDIIIYGSYYGLK